MQLAVSAWVAQGIPGLDEPAAEASPELRVIRERWNSSSHFLLHAMHYPDVAAKQEALVEVGFDEYYMRLSPTFDTPIGPHDWLTRHVIVGCGERHAEYSVFHYYVLR